MDKIKKLYRKTVYKTDPYRHSEFVYDNSTGVMFVECYDESRKKVACASPVRINKKLKKILKKA